MADDTAPAAPATAAEPAPADQAAPATPAPADTALKSELDGLQNEMRRAMAEGNSREARRLSERAARLRSGDQRPQPPQEPIPEATHYDAGTVRPRTEAEVAEEGEAVQKAVEAGFLVRREDGRVDDAASWSTLTDGALAPGEADQLRTPFQQVDRELGKVEDREGALAKSEGQVLSSLYKGDQGAMEAAIGEVNRALDTMPAGDALRHWLDRQGYLAHPQTHRLVVSKAREVLAKKGRK